jgi:hypothetical protein
MRKMIPMLTVAGVVASFGLVAFAAEVKTIVGEALCAKCALKETKSCQNVVSVKEDDKTVKYYLEHNDVSKKAHGSLGICTAKKDKPVKVKAKGEVKEENGKKILTPTELTKE